MNGQAQRQCEMPMKMSVTFQSKVSGLQYQPFNGLVEQLSHSSSKPAINLPLSDTDEI